MPQAFELNATEAARCELRLIDLCPRGSGPKSFVHYLLRVNFDQWGLKTTMEDYVVSQALNIWTKMFQKALEWKPEWIGLELEELIGAEAASKRTIDEEIQLPKVLCLCPSSNRLLTTLVTPGSGSVLCASPPTPWRQTPAACQALTTIPYSIL